MLLENAAVKKFAMFLTKLTYKMDLTLRKNFDTRNYNHIKK